MNSNVQEIKLHLHTLHWSPQIWKKIFITQLLNPTIVSPSVESNIIQEKSHCVIIKHFPVFWLQNTFETQQQWVYPERISQLVWRIIHKPHCQVFLGTVSSLETLKNWTNKTKITVVKLIQTTLASYRGRKTEFKDRKHWFKAAEIYNKLAKMNNVQKYMTKQSWRNQKSNSKNSLFIATN